MFNSLEALEKNGFKGFVSVKDLCNDRGCIPKKMGVYFVVLPVQHKVDFMENNPAGFRGGRNPTVSIEELEQNWVSDTLVLYIGKAKKFKERIHCYLKHGMGSDSAAHWGGRMIWQVKDSQNLLFCWKKSDKVDSFEDERELINSFCEFYKKRPFANHTGGGKILKALAKKKFPKNKIL